MTIKLSPKPVLLDYTLRDLYSLDGGQHSDIVLAYALPSSRIQVASSLPLTGKLLSKPALALSGLPTPKTIIIETQIKPVQVHDPCAVNAEVRRMLLPLYKKGIPFVVKLPQANSSEGTLVLKSEHDRQRAGEVLKDEIRRMIHDLHPKNHHLNPCSLVFQDFVEGDCMAMSLFVTQSGRWVFIGCCNQRFFDSGLWAGGCISYLEQPQLKANFTEIGNEVAEYLHDQEYFGPVGVDIIVDSNGNSFIIDMNIRVSGTYHLGCLRSHFVERGLFEVLLVSSIDLEGRKHEFQQFFENEVVEGSMLFTSWTTNMPERPNNAAICVAAADKFELEDLVTRVEVFRVN
ncbi:uncharacterized protein MYU51_010811 [Penicillium brevicompactum]|uniref:uncharacterized protein n=1 Tax=Penicillium brevicompactum TaxID=5074 RepID=UPI002541B027|nr:uncharacterized protein N7506_009151 [Penicillium brevicompactum]KAJ5326049.1 hypothetical protein N7506_009151 [Penicillium brevicompactum]